MAVALAISFLLTACANSSGESGAADLGVDNGETNEFVGKSLSEVNQYITTPTDFIMTMQNNFSGSPSASMRNVMDIPRSNNNSGNDSTAANFFDEAFRNSRAKIILEILTKQTDIINLLEGTNGSVVQINKKLIDLSAADANLRWDSIWLICRDKSTIKQARYWNKGSYVELVFALEEIRLDLSTMNSENQTYSDPLDDLFYVRVSTRNTTEQTEKSNVYMVLNSYDKSGNLLERMQENLVVKSPGVRELRIYDMFVKDAAHEYDIITADVNTGNVAKQYNVVGGPHNGGYINQYISATDKRIYYDIGNLPEAFYTYTTSDNQPTTKVGKKLVFEIVPTIDQKSYYHKIPNGGEVAQSAAITQYYNAIKGALSGSSRLTSFTQGYVTAIESSRLVMSFD